MRNKALILDFDGTMVNSLPLWHEVDLEFLGKRNIELPDDLLGIIEGMNLYDCAVYFKERFLLTESEEMIIDEWKTLIREKYKELPLKDGLSELLEEWLGPIAIASSSERDLIDSVLKKHKLEDVFSAIVTTAEVGASKPLPDVYLEAARQLGYHPSHCYVIEDTHTGVLGANNAGMTSIAFYDEMNKKWEETRTSAHHELLSFYKWKEVIE